MSQLAIELMRAEARSNRLHQSESVLSDTMHKSLPVAGYKPQSSTKVDLVNHNKEAEEHILRSLDALWDRPEDDIDYRWLTIGIDLLEQAFMAINRSIFKPARVTLPSDKMAVGAVDAAREIA